MGRDEFEVTEQLKGRNPHRREGRSGVPLQPEQKRGETQEVGPRLQTLFISGGRKGVGRLDKERKHSLSSDGPFKKRVPGS